MVAFLALAVRSGDGICARWGSAEEDNRWGTAEGDTRCPVPSPSMTLKPPSDTLGTLNWLNTAMSGSEGFDWRAAGLSHAAYVCL